MNAVVEEKYGFALALGYFDSVHFGHRKIISAMVEYAKNNGLRSSVFTFSNDFYAYFGDFSGQIYTFSERKDILTKMGVDIVSAYKFDDKFKSLSPSDFLDLIKIDLNPSKIFCGYDYTFGKNSKGTVKDLIKYFGADNVVVFDKIDLMGARVSSSSIKQLIKEGNISDANKLLAEPYSITGRVVKGRGEGHIHGFPTANMQVQPDKLLPSRGVYATYTNVDGVRFRSVTNIGVKPTFNDMTDTVESFLVNFSGDIYGKTVCLEFYAKLRDTRAFSSPEDLKQQIYVDVKQSEELC